MAKYKYREEKEMKKNLKNLYSKNDNTILYVGIATAGISLLLWYFWKKRKTEYGKSESGAPDKTESVASDKTESGPFDKFGNRMSVDFVWGVLQGYEHYCDEKGWNYNFKTTQETAKNIYLHYLIETGSGKYLHDCNTHNLTAGSWKTDARKASPYIGEWFGHEYLGTRIRADRGEKNDQQEFRMYDCLACGIMDYLDLVNRSKRYAGIPILYNQKDPVFIRELGRAGYFSADPDKIYQEAKKLKENL